MCSPVNKKRKLGASDESFLNLLNELDMTYGRNNLVHHFKSGFEYNRIYKYSDNSTVNIKMVNLFDEWKIESKQIVEIEAKSIK